MTIDRVDSRREEPSDGSSLLRCAGHDTMDLEARVVRERDAPIRSLNGRAVAVAHHPWEVARRAVT
jgi:hypothetical protein